MKLSEEIKRELKQYEYNCYFPYTYKYLKCILPRIEELELKNEPYNNPS